MGSQLLNLATAVLLGLTVTALPRPGDDEVGPDSTLQSLSDRITELRERGDYAAAAVVADSLLWEHRKNRQAEPWKVLDAAQLLATLRFVSGLSASAQVDLARADRLTGEVVRLRTEGNYEQGLKLAQEQVAIRRRHLGEQDPDLARSLHALAGLLHRTGDYAGAQRTYEEVLEIRQKALGPEHPDLAHTMNNLGLVLADLGDYDGARSLYERSLKIRETVLGPEHLDVAGSLNNLGLLFVATGDYEMARHLYERALAIKKKRLGPEHPDMLLALDNLAILLWRTADYEGARALSEHVLALREKALGPEHPDLAYALNILGLLLWEAGDHASARPLFERALEIRERVLGTNHPLVAEIQDNLALLLKSIGEIAQARSLHERALRIREEAFGPGHPAVGVTLGNLGLLLYDAEEYEAARSMLERALAIRQGALGPEHPLVASTLHHLATVAWATGDRESARGLYERSLAILERSLEPDHPKVAACLRQVGVLHWSAGQPLEAESVLVRAADVFEKARLRMPAGFSRATYGSPRSPYAELAAVRLTLGKREEAWVAAEGSLGRTLAERLASSGRAVGSQPRVAGRTLRLETVQKALGRNAALVGWLHVQQDFDRFVSWGYVIRDSGTVNWVGLPPAGPDRDDPAGQEIREFRESLLNAACWPFRVTSTARTTREAQRLWERWVAPLEPYLGGVEHLVVVASPPLLGLPIEALVDDASVYMAERYAISYVPSATVLAWLSQQGIRGVGDGIQRALLVGDPPFTEGQLAAMVSDVAADVPVGMVWGVPSPSHVGETVLRSALARSQTALASLPRLRRTREEIEGIASLIPEAVTLLGSDASEQELESLAESGALRGFDLIHFATHGLIDEERPEQSALVLSRTGLLSPLETVASDERRFDGLLSAKEIALEWDLDATLVTLSACQTALGREAGGEGYLGLAYPFLQAGARSLLVSLWKVEDRATALLMRRFYENLTGSYAEEDRNATELSDVGPGGRPQGRPMSKVEALQEAKRWLRTLTDEDGEQPFRHPAYWSGFILIGDAT